MRKVALLALFALFAFLSQANAQDHKSFLEPEVCAQCHEEIYKQ